MTADLAAKTAAANNLLDSLKHDTYSSFATFCDNAHCAGPTALAEEDPDFLMDELHAWLTDRAGLA